MNELSSYRTIAGQSQAYLKELGSKFHALAFPVNSENEILSSLQECKEMFPGATHYCFAWRLGVKEDNYRANDDGEPSNSAGQPILRAILSHHLTNILVVVVRFYGGKKLGIPGLISSYGNVANDALTQSQIIIVEASITFSIREITRQDYRVYEFANRHELEIVNTPTQLGGSFTLNSKKNQWLIVAAALKELPYFDWQVIKTDI